MKYIITVLSLISFSLPVKAITSYSKDLYIPHHVSDNASLEVYEHFNYKRERARIRKQNPCNLQNQVGINTNSSFSSLLIAQVPQPLPNFNSSCKIRRA